jgi:DNA-binding transcriptional LysR family regulator
MATLRALECLVALIEERSVTKAAVTLGMSQPALSHQIAAIEREIGTAAVERLARGVRPTAAGMAAAEFARRALDSAAQAMAVGRAAGQGSAGRVRIVCSETITGSVLPPVLRRWRAERPQVNLVLSEHRSADRMIAALEAGDADVAICPQPSLTHAHLQILGHDEMVVVSSPDHRFSGLVAVRPADLEGEPFIHYHRDNGNAAWVDQFAAENRIVLDPVLRTRSPRTAAQLAAAGMGVTIAPSSALIPMPDGAVRSLDPVVVRNVVVATMSTQDSLVRQFVADLIRHGLPLPVMPHVRAVTES